jgi:flagellin
MSVINTNVKALTAQASLSNVNKTMATAMERLSTGSRINSAKDDAAGMAITQRMTSDIRGFAVAMRNANDGISMSQTAEGGLGQINDMLQRMRELAVQSSNGSASADNRAASQLEVTQLKQEIDNIASRTNFNGIKLLDGSAAKLNLQTGVNAGDTMTLQVAAAGSKDIGLGARSSLTATGSSGDQGVLAKNLAAGDLTINGVAVGASSADDDLISASPLETATFVLAAGTGTFIIDGTTIASATYATGVAAATAVAAGTYANYTAAADGLGGVVFTAKTAGNKTDLANTGSLAATSTTIAQGGGDKSSSAIAKVVAINRVSEQTGVIATASATTVTGSAMTAAAGTGTITVNGVKTASFSTTADAGVSRANTAAAINSIADQTGVRAIDTGDVNKGVVLVADDGRNITTSLQASTATGFTAVTTGIGAAGVTTAGYTLASTTGAPVVIGSTSNGTVANAGLTAGTYEANISVVSSTARAVAATTVAPSTTSTGLLQAGTMKINGISIDAAITADDTASDVTATSSTKAASAIAIAEAINKKSAQTGVVAKAEPNVIVGTAFTAAARTDMTLSLNGTAIALTTTTSSTRGDLVESINEFSGQTGVVASDNGRGLTLTAADGRNISMGYMGTGAATAGALDLGLPTTAVNSNATTGTAANAITSYARVTLSSDLTFTLEGGSDGNGSLEKLGFKAGTIGGSNNGVKIASVDVSTQAGAQVAITALDAAMKSVSMSQAQLGAFQNRLDAVVSNLTVADLNMNASRSRIQDTDYAKESTNLAKAQIISQAATAMLAQANQSGQSVLALLK